MGGSLVHPEPNSFELQTIFDQGQVTLRKFPSQQYQSVVPK